MKNNTVTSIQFTPTNQNFTFEPITVPNKNITSYFMKNEVSYLTPESIKYQGNTHASPLLFITIDNTYFQIEDTRIEQDCIINNRLNIEKYGTRNKCLDCIYNKLYTQLQTISNSTDTNTVDSSSGITSSQVVLVFNDFIGRSDIIALVDIFLNMLGFKCILLLPSSLCLAINLNQCYSAFVYPNGYSFVDDFCLIDCFDYYNKEKTHPRIHADDEDFAEEYSRLNVLTEEAIYSCDECGLKEDTEEKVTTHALKEHKTVSVFKFERDSEEKSISFEEQFKNRLRFLFKKELLERIDNKVYAVGCDFVGAERIENALEQAISGAKIFCNLELSKELWMTGAEWRVGRLRVLKEKLLFYI